MPCSSAPMEAGLDLTCEATQARLTARRCIQYVARRLKAAFGKKRTFQQFRLACTRLSSFR